VAFASAGRFDGEGIITYILTNGVYGGHCMSPENGCVWSALHMDAVGSPDEERQVELGGMKLS